MKKVLYYVILVAIFIVFGVTITILFSEAGSKPGGMIYNSLMILAFAVTSMISKYVKKWLGIEEENSN